MLGLFFCLKKSTMNKRLFSECPVSLRLKIHEYSYNDLKFNLCFQRIWQLARMMFRRQTSQINVCVTMDSEEPAASQVPSTVSELFSDGLMSLFQKEVSEEMTSTIDTSDIFSEANNHNATTITSNFYNGNFNTTQTGNARVTSGSSVDVTDYTASVDNVTQRQNNEASSLLPHIKQELKYTIQSKRLAEGKEELKVDFTHPPEYDVITQFSH